MKKLTKEEINKNQYVTEFSFDLLKQIEGESEITWHVSNRLKLFSESPLFIKKHAKYLFFDKLEEFTSDIERLNWDFKEIPNCIEVSNKEFLEICKIVAPKEIKMCRDEFEETMRNIANFLLKDNKDLDIEEMLAKEMEWFDEHVRELGDAKR